MVEKIVFYRPHLSNWYKNSWKNILRKNIFPSKYELFFDWIINSNRPVFFMCDVTGGGFASLLYITRDILNIIFWCYLNKIPLSRIKIASKFSKFTSADYLVLIHYGNLTHENPSLAQKGSFLANELANFPGKKIVHMTHFAYNAKIAASNLKYLSPDLLIAENNLLKNSKFFNKQFPGLTNFFYQLPYVPNKKFIKKGFFGSRLNKLVVTGSITFKMRDKEFIEFYGTSELQPIRRLIYQNWGLYKDCIQSEMFDLDAQRLASKKRFVSKIAGKIKRGFFSHSNAQDSYYKIDIVDLYNSYKMFAVPEEICDLPAIGFVEGMACGCVYFGVESAMYRDLGMLPNVHYVSYDGSIDDLVNKVRYYQSREDELERIANNGCDFVQNNLNPDVVYSKFLDYLSATDQLKGQSSNAE